MRTCGSYAESSHGGSPVLVARRHHGSPDPRENSIMLLIPLFAARVDLHSGSMLAIGVVYLVCAGISIAHGKARGVPPPQENGQVQVAPEEPPQENPHQ